MLENATIRIAMIIDHYKKIKKIYKTRLDISLYFCRQVKLLNKTFNILSYIAY